MRAPTSLKWANLKRNKCPKCNEDLCQNPAREGFYECSNGQSCDFVISDRRFREIVTARVTQSIKDDGLQIGEEEFI